MPTLFLQTLDDIKDKKDLPIRCFISWISYEVNILQWKVWEVL